MGDETKKCPKCGGEFPATLEFFNRSRPVSGGLHCYCRECHKDYGREYRKSGRKPNINIAVDLKGEEWLPVVGHEKLYSVSNLGRIKRTGKGAGATVGRLLKYNKDRYGYYHVVFINNATRYEDQFHRVVMAAFVGPCPEGLQVNHIDSNKINNKLENLEYVTPSRNIRHTYENGRKASRGEDATNVKLKNKDVLEIKKLLKKGEMPQGKIAEIYKVHFGTISNISLGKSWSWLK